jgi:hypothetical protein
MSFGVDKPHLNYSNGRHWWLTPVILAIQEAEIRRVAV